MIVRPLDRRAGGSPRGRDGDRVCHHEHAGCCRGTARRAHCRAGRSRADLHRRAPGPVDASAVDAMTTATDFEKLGVFYLGRPCDLAARKPQARARALRLEGPRHPRGLRRHDRQRQDRPVPRAARGGGASTASRPSLIDPKGDLAESPAHLPRAARRRISRRGSTRTTRASKGLAPADYARAAGRAVDEGPRRVGPGRRAHPAPAGRGGLRHLHAGQRRRASRSRSSSPSRRRRRRSATTASSSASASPAPRRACSACSASTPTRSRAASTSCSRPSSTPRGAQGRDLDLAALIQRDPDAARHARRRARPRVVLSRRKDALRARDGAQQPARLARASRPGCEGEPLDIGRMLYTPDGQAARSPSSRSRTWATPSACSSSRCC